MATCAGDGEVRVIDLEQSAVPPSVFHHHHDRVKKLVTLPGDGNTFLSCSEDATGARGMCGARCPGSRCFGVDRGVHGWLMMSASIAAPPPPPPLPLYGPDSHGQPLKWRPHMPCPCSPTGGSTQPAGDGAAASGAEWRQAGREQHKQPQASTCTRKALVAVVAPLGSAALLSELARLVGTRLNVCRHKPWLLAVGACDDRLRIYDRRMTTPRGTSRCVQRFSPIEHMDVAATEGLTGPSCFASRDAE